MAAFLKAKGFKGANLRTLLERLGHGAGGEVQLDFLRQDDPILEADLVWHVRAWGRWVLGKARTELAAYYPTYAEFEPLKSDAEFEPRHRRLLEVDDAGVPQADPLNAEFDDAYLADPRNPRWIAKPTVAYLWARTVTCKQCRVSLPLLKTRWLCKKDRKRVLLTMEPKTDQTGVVFGVQNDVPHNGGNAAQRREHDKRVGVGTMSRTGATCPCCGAITTMEDIRFEGRAGRLGEVMTVVVVDGPKGKGKEYRLPTDHERAVAEVTEEQLQALYADIPFGLPEEPLASAEALGFRVPLYGFDTWRKLFTNRQLLALGEFVLTLRSLMQELDSWPESWREALIANLALVHDRLADYSSAICSWHNSGEKIGHTFGHFALPIVWDYTEVNPLSDSSGNYLGALDWVSRCVDHIHDAEDGELIDDASRFGGDKERSKQNYEDGMARSFRACHAALQPDGRLVVVFANKHPDAWEILVAALIRASFVVDGSWPIQTEMSTRTRAMASAALSSSVWIVCKKRPFARPSWDNTVLNEMRDNSSILESLSNHVAARDDVQAPRQRVLQFGDQR